MTIIIAIVMLRLGMCKCETVYACESVSFPQSQSPSTGHELRLLTFFSHILWMNSNRVTQIDHDSHFSCISFCSSDWYCKSTTHGLARKYCRITLHHFLVRPPEMNFINFSFAGWIACSYAVRTYISNLRSFLDGLHRLLAQFFHYTKIIQWFSCFLSFV